MKVTLEETVFEGGRTIRFVLYMYLHVAMLYIVLVVDVLIK